jgi:large conductance mechanosensitive channel
MAQIGKEATGLLKEFRDFAMRGNVVDLAVGVVIGGAFGKIVSSLVGDVIMPILTLFTSSADFTGLKYVIHAAKDGAPEAAINYGTFIQTIIDFVIIAFCIFLLVKAMNTLRRKEEAIPAAPPEPTQSEKYLAEIRDILKNEGK